MKNTRTSVISLICFIETFYQQSQLISRCLIAVEGPEQNPFCFSDNKSRADGWVELVDNLTAL